MSSSENIDFIIFININIITLHFSAMIPELLT